MNSRWHHWLLFWPVVQQRKWDFRRETTLAHLTRALSVACLNGERATAWTSRGAIGNLRGLGASASF